MKNDELASLRNELGQVSTRLTQTVTSCHLRPSVITTKAHDGAITQLLIIYINNVSKHSLQLSDCLVFDDKLLIKLREFHRHLFHHRLIHIQQLSY